MNNNERIGVSRVQLVVNEQMKWIFRELSIKDYGIDAHIEVMGKSYATGKLIGVQIKCGDSYFKELKNDNVIFRFNEKHYTYWLNYSVPVIIVLVNPNSKEIIWEVVTRDHVIKVNENTYKINIKRENMFGKQAISQLLEISERKKEESGEKYDGVEENGDYFELGYKYEFGEDGEVDYIKARHYYKLAADNGNKVAQFNYALLLLHGKGGGIDYSQAYLYMKKSALQEFVPAEYNLGLLFFHGKELYKRDIKEAQKWLKKASKNGHENAKIWLMYCELYERIHGINTPDIKMDTIPFVDSFNSLINKISVRDMRFVIEEDIQQSNIVGWKKGIFFIASKAEVNARKQGNMESVEFWNDFQKIILLFDLLGQYYNYQFENLVINIDSVQLEKIWNEQLCESDDKEWDAAIFLIACNEIKSDSVFWKFWNHVIKCSDLLRRLENYILGENAIYEKISIEIYKKACLKVGVAIKNVSFYLNENNDIRIGGNVEAMEEYKTLGKLIIKADLCDALGRTLYTLKEYSEIKLHLSGYDGFGMSCCAIERFFDLKRFCKIRIYPVVE